MSRGWGAQQTSRPAPLTQLVYLEDMEVVPTMISTYKACVEPWENHLDGKQEVWSGSRGRIAKITRQSATYCSPEKGSLWLGLPNEPPPISPPPVTDWTRPDQTRLGWHAAGVTLGPHWVELLTGVTVVASRFLESCSQKPL